MAPDVGSTPTPAVMNQPQATGHWIIIDPYYEAEKAYSLHLPDSGKNPMAQQGKVVSVGPDQTGIEVGDYVLVHPFVGRRLYWNNYEYLVFAPWEIAAWMSEDDGEVFPLPHDVLVIPAFPESGHVKKGHLYVIQEVFDDHLPKHRGKIVRCGDLVTSVVPGQVVLFDNRGHEIGVDAGKRQVYYAVAEADLLAVISEAN